MDTAESLYEKYVNSLQNDIQRGCAMLSDKTNELLAFYQEVVYRQSIQVNDEVTADELLTYTSQNYE